jgi:hypothetical protein
MSVTNKIAILQSEVLKSRDVLKKIESYYENFLRQDFVAKERKTDHAIIISELICNYYTCLETIFLRISQFFENSLLKEKWHQDLLHKMTLNIPDVRPLVISDATYRLLLELLKFRHFKRYYFELNYDWDKLEFVQKKFSQVKIQIDNELNQFLDSLNKLN